MLNGATGQHEGTSLLFHGTFTRFRQVVYFDLCDFFLDALWHHGVGRS